MAYQQPTGPPVQVPKLKPAELFDKRRTKDTARLKAYNKLLEQIYTRIRTSSQSGGDPWILYTVPPFLLGLPKIDLEDCIVYIVYILRQQDYEVRYTYPNLLYISWKHHERDYILKNSPIMSAMLQGSKTKASEPRKGPGQSAHVRFADELVQGPAPRGGGGTALGSFRGTLDTNMARGGMSVGGGGRAPPRSATDYQPPTSFLDALEKPSAAPRKEVLDDFLLF